MQRSYGPAGQVVSIRPGCTPPLAVLIYSLPWSCTRKCPPMMPQHGKQELKEASDQHHIEICGKVWITPSRLAQQGHMPCSVDPRAGKGILRHQLPDVNTYGDFRAIRETTIPNGAWRGGGEEG
jgi:hypothetical protein